MGYQYDLLQRHLAYKLGYSWVVVEGVVAETLDLLALNVDVDVDVDVDVLEASEKQRSK